MAEQYKKTILIDLDGVLNKYQGNYNESYIPPIKDGALEFIKKLSDEYKIKIFTSRKLFLTSKWLIENNMQDFIDDVTNIKEPSYLMIDDRCINFNGNYEELNNKINNFQVWFK